MTINDEFDMGDAELDAMLDGGKKLTKAEAAAKAKIEALAKAEEEENAAKDLEPRAKVIRKAKPKSEPAPEPDEEVECDFEVTEKRIKPEPPTSSPLVRIMIDEVQGMSNYETVSPNGKVYKIKRGVPVMVPQEVVNVLESCIMTNIEEHKNPITGEREEVKKHFSAIPWRKM